MDPENAIDLSREAIRTCIFVGGPILLVCLLIGLAMSVFQAMTQLHDQTISFVPKILLLIVTIGLCLPWLSDRMSEFATLSFEKPMFGMNSPDVKSLADQPNNDSTRPVDRVALLSKRTVNRGGHSRFQLMGNSSQRDAAPLFENGGSLGGKQEESRDEEFLPPKPRTVSPFLLPHYRYEVEPREDTEG